MKANLSSYRPDIDGLRAIAVLSVLFFHSGIELFAGGFVGVDVFFVISGYLITTIIFREMRDGSFSFLGFYQRRVARIIPAALITMLLVVCLGFFLSPPDEFRSLGKDIIFSSVGAMNILLGRGVDYFAQDGNIQPLVHFWSLGVEEQFYVIWPVFLLFAVRFNLKTILSISTLLLLLSLAASMWAVKASFNGSYYLLQYRAFELLIGCILAIVIHAGYLPAIKNTYQQMVVSCAAVLMLLAPVFLLDANSRFPGFNALWPCIGAALLVAFPGKGLLYKLLSFYPLVAIGLISYPLYLYHQPVLAFYANNVASAQPGINFLVIILVCVPASWVTWAYVEHPLRRLVKSASQIRMLVFCLLVFSVPAMAGAGYYIYSNGGFPNRFQRLNPFAHEMIAARSDTFRSRFKGGFQVSPSSSGRVLFLGDSTMQHYAVPFAESLGLKSSEVDTITLGGCTLLKGVNFADIYTGSCDKLRPEVYELNKKWDTVVISQHWRKDVEKTSNKVFGTEGLNIWIPHIKATIDHFTAMGADIILVGDHPYSSGAERLRANVLINEMSYGRIRDSIAITNVNEMQLSKSYFDAFAISDNVSVVHPVDIVCATDCKTHDGEWSFYRDRLHFSSAATLFLADGLRKILDR